MLENIFFKCLERPFLKAVTLQDYAFKETQDKRKIKQSKLISFC